ncbi:hypothetical protein CR513_57285, partial [Mucuna pruriens]
MNLPQHSIKISIVHSVSSTGQDARKLSMTSPLTSTETKRSTLSDFISKLIDDKTLRMYTLVSKNGSVKWYEQSRSNTRTFFSAANLIHSAIFQGLPKST